MSFDDLNSLSNILNRNFPVVVLKVEKLRDWIGYVYLVKCTDKMYIFKIYRHFHNENALNSIGIIQYLMEINYPVTRIVNTQDETPYIIINTQYGRHIAILFEYIKGVEPEKEIEIENIARQIGLLHNAMKNYRGSIVVHGKEYFITRYINLCEKIDLNTEKIMDLKRYGNELWDRIQKSSPGFCHADLHCGNMIRDKSGVYHFFDFDSACSAFSIIDVAVLSDDTDYFTFNIDDFDKTTVNIMRFTNGYNKECTVSDQDIKRVYDFIAIRHFDIQSTISECQGCSKDLIENQHKWLMNWENLCEKKIKF